MNSIEIFRTFMLISIFFIFVGCPQNGSPSPQNDSPSFEEKKENTLKELYSAILNYKKNIKDQNIKEYQVQCIKRSIEELESKESLEKPIFVKVILYPTKKKISDLECTLFWLDPGTDVIGFIIKDNNKEYIYTSISWPLNLSDSLEQDFIRMWTVPIYIENEKTHLDANQIASSYPIPMELPADVFDKDIQICLIYRYGKKTKFINPKR